MKTLANSLARRLLIQRVMTPETRSLPWLAGLLIASAASLVPRPAQACGGCFGPVDTQQVITDHRMVMAIHANEAILWDQVRYSGRPEDFSWVLPVSGDVRVEVASGEFFDALDAQTAVQVSGPIPPSCSNSGFGRGFGAPSLSARSDAGAQDESSVTVLRTEVVGPYQTVILRSSDSNALVTWLRSNNYAIPAAIMPTIEWYTQRHMDFVALRLNPGEGVNAMQPIRIRYNSMNVVLPLRMVAAGIADKVGILLWVFGTGRWEAANFTNATVNSADLSWNYNTNRSDYPDVFAATIRNRGGRVWITEYAQGASNLGYRFTYDTTAPGRDDWMLATENNASGAWITRMRTDLLAQYLDNDLLLQASGTSAGVSNRLRTTHVIGTAPQPVCSPDRSPGLGGGGGAGFVCAARPGRTGATGGMLLIACIGGASAMASRRRSRPPTR